MSDIFREEGEVFNNDLTFMYMKCAEELIFRRNFYRIGRQVGILKMNFEYIGRIRQAISYFYKRYIYHAVIAWAERSFIFIHIAAIRCANRTHSHHSMIRWHFRQDSHYMTVIDMENAKRYSIYTNLDRITREVIVFEIDCSQIRRIGLTPFKIDIEIKKMALTPGWTIRNLKFIGVATIGIRRRT